MTYVDPSSAARPPLAPDGGMDMDAIEHRDTRLTDAAREALIRAGSEVLPGSEPHLWHVLLRVVPPGLAVAYAPGPDGYRVDRLLVRLAGEPPCEPREMLASWWDHGAWAPCPHPGCGRALAWHEAGYVPGHRLCLRGHHVQLDGRGVPQIAAED